MNIFATKFNTKTKKMNNELLIKFNTGNATLLEQAEVLSFNTWVGTPEEKEKRKKEYVAIRQEHGEEKGRFWEILNNY